MSTAYILFVVILNYGGGGGPTTAELSNKQSCEYAKKIVVREIKGKFGSQVHIEATCFPKDQVDE